MTRFHDTLNGPVPFTPEEEAEWDAMVATAPDRLQQEQITELRNERNQRLTDCDWTQLADSPLDPDTKNAWALYREALRMVPQQDGFPNNVTWPPKPTT